MLVAFFSSMLDGWDSSDGWMVYRLIDWLFDVAVYEIAITFFSNCILHAEMYE